MAVAVGKPWQLADRGDGRGDMLAQPVVLPLGPLTQDATTPEQLPLYMTVTGALDAATTALVEYKLASSGTWLDAQPMRRLPVGGLVTQDAFASTVFDLVPGETYDVRVTVTDPGAGTEEKTGQFTTRPLPADTSATPADYTATNLSEFTSALSSAVSGEIIEVQGQINLSSTLTIGNKDGITIRGDNRDTAILFANGFTAFRPENADGWIFEELTFRGDGVNRAGGPAHFGVKDNCSNFTFRRCRFDDYDVGIKGIDDYSSSAVIPDGFLINDCVFVSNDAWQGYGSEHWDDTAVGLIGNNHCVWNCDFSYFGDTLKLSSTTNSPSGATSHGVFFYRNKIVGANDDAVEFDTEVGTLRNCGAYDNYILNAATGASIDGVPGGPFYYFRNRVINVAKPIVKCGGTANNVLIYHNTFVCIGSATLFPGNRDIENMWFWSGAARPSEWELRNNLMIWEGTNDMVFWVNDFEDHLPAVITNNGWGRNGQDIGVDGGGGTTVADIQANHPGYFVNDIEITGQTQEFGAGNEVVWVGGDFQGEVTTEYDLALDAGADSVGAGIVLANITR